MNILWDYDKGTLERTESGRIKILERRINYGRGDNKKISRSEVKKYWDKLNLFAPQKHLFESLIWGKKK